MACQKALRDELRLYAVAPGLEVTVQGRLKSLWSTHMKMQRKVCGAREVYDARALRVVVEDTSTQDVGVETEACYSLLSAVHKLWKPVGGEYDNYRQATGAIVWISRCLLALTQRCLQYVSPPLRIPRCCPLALTHSHPISSPAASPQSRTL